MDSRIKESLLKLLGRQDLVDEMEKRVDGVNTRTVDDGLIARQEADPKEEAAPPAEVKRDDAAPIPSEADVIAGLRTKLAELEAQVQEYSAALKAFAGDTSERIARLERSEAERRRAWLADLPEYKRQPPEEIWRPRASAQADDKPLPANERAAAILASKKAGG